MNDGLIDQIIRNVLQGRRNRTDEGLEDTMEGEPGVSELVKQALEEGITVDSLINGLSSGMESVGAKFQGGEYFIPDMLAAAEAVEAGMDVLKPHLVNGNGNKGKFIMATVENDQHDIGKNLVSIMLKGAGYTVIDLGVDVPADRIVEAAEKEQAGFIGLSALLSTTMPYMHSTVQALEKKGLRDKVKVIIGGAPTSNEFARKIGADAYGKDAFDAVRAANKLFTVEGDR